VWTWLAPEQALAHTIAVLIVTCPCALALATPVALAIAAGGAVTRGALALRMSALERLAGADLVAFDKTGTLTQGSLHLAECECCGDVEAGHALAIAAALEQFSDHPLGRSLRARAAGGPLPRVAHCQQAPGAGVSGRIDGRNWRLGHLDFAAPNARLPAAAAVRAATWRQRDMSVVFLADESGVQALFGFSDTLRPGVAAMLDEVRRQGIRRFAILSGDDQGVVARLGQELGIDTALGRLSPSDKMAWVQQAQRDGHRVLMVGDGFNDAGTLSVADVSASFAGSSELAQSSADLLILGQDIQALARVRGYARRTRKVVAQNLAWAALYNLAAVPAAALGLVPPWLAAIGMSVSSLVVVANSLRLQRADAARPLSAPTAHATRNAAVTSAA
jgi:Cu2+-exporting ATPase